MGSDREPSILLTGSTGFVGSHLAAGLRQRSYRLTEVNRRGPSTGTDRIVWDFLKSVPSDFPRQVDIIIHCASPVGNGSTAHAEACADLNVLATDRLLKYGELAGAKLFVLVSSGAVYGMAAQARSENDPLNPSGAYACSKAAGELLVKAHEKSMRVQALRLFYPYGPGQAPPRLVPHLMERILHGQPVVLNDPQGRPRMNPVYIEDLVNWMIRLMELETASGVYNLGGTEVVSVRHLAEMLGSLLAQPVRFECRAEDCQDSIGDTTRARETVGFAPEWTMARGLAEVVQSTPA